MWGFQHKDWMGHHKKCVGCNNPGPLVLDLLKAHYFEFCHATCVSIILGVHFSFINMFMRRLGLHCLPMYKKDARLI